MKNRRLWYLLLGLIIAVGLFLRVFQLGTIPGGLTWDEAAIGYNGWSVLTTRRDEWLERLPISFRSFGDYKAPVAIYLNGPFTYFFGFSALSIRLPFALTGCLLVVIWCWFLLWLEKRKVLSLESAVFGTTLLAFSPWHIVFSRIGFESGLSLTFLVISVFALLYFLHRPSQYWSIAIAIIAGVGSIYAYHSAKIVVPLLIIWIYFLWRKQIQTQKKALSTAILVGVVLLLPLGNDSIVGKGATRAGDLWILANTTLIEKLQTFSQSLLRNLDPRFLIFGYHEELRHVSGKFGIISPAILGLIIGAGVGWIKGIWNKSDPESIQLIKFAAGWMLIGMLPSWLSTLSPHANRALLALPGMLLLSIFVFEWLIKQVRFKTSYELLSKIVICFIVLTELIWISMFSFDYFTQYAARASGAYNEGYAEVVAIAKEAESGIDRPAVEQIVISSWYGQPYIYVLLFNQISPIAYHNGALVKYLFKDQITMGELTRHNTLLIYTPLDDEMTIVPQGTIFGSDGKPRFYWYITE